MHNTLYKYILYHTYLHYLALCMDGNCFFFPPEMKLDTSLHLNRKSLLGILMLNDSMFPNREKEPMAEIVNVPYVQ